MANNFDTTLLKSLVNINSVYPHEQKIGEFLFSYLKDAGFLVEKHEFSKGRFNLFAQKNPKEGTKAIMFYGHMDTVPLVNTEEWESDPFELHEKDGRLYGLGTNDMKGGIVAFIEASKSTDSYCKIFLAADEENISEGAWSAVEEKRDFFDDVELIISAEPNFGNGTHSITRGRTGRCIFEVNFEGKPVHIAKYKEGQDAIEIMSNFISNLYERRDSLFDSEDTVVQVRKVSGESVGMSVCGNAQIEIESMIGLHDSIEGVREKIQSLTSFDVSLKPRKTTYLTSYYFEKFAYMEDISEIISRFTHKDMVLITRSSVGDDNVLATLGIPVITWGPDGGNSHCPNEYVEIESIGLMTEMYKELLSRV